MENFNLAIVTPTYNRVKFLKKLYQSLLSQTYTKFIWIIVNDGSTDSTKEYINYLISKDIIKIIYIEQHNGGKARALNSAFKCNADAFLVIDSDDYILHDGVEKVIEVIGKYISNEEVGAYFFNYMDDKGSLLGKRKKYNSNEVILGRTEYNNEYGQHDGAICYLKEVVKKFNYPEFKNENYVGPTTLQIQMEKEYKILFSSQTIGVANYLPKGLTNSGRNLRLINPQGMYYYSKLLILSKSNFRTKVKYYTCIWTYAKLANKHCFNVINEFDNKILIILFYIPGTILYFFWNFLYK